MIAAVLKEGVDEIGQVCHHLVRLRFSQARVVPLTQALALWHFLPLRVHVHDVVVALQPAKSAVSMKHYEDKAMQKQDVHVTHPVQIHISRSGKARLLKIEKETDASSAIWNSKQIWTAT